MSTQKILINRNANAMVHTNDELGSEKYPEVEWYECDEFIAPAVVAFNKKGYETLYSCSGHIAKSDENEDGSYCMNELYVTLKKTNPNKNLLKLLQACHWDMLEGFEIEKHKDPKLLFTIRHRLCVTYNEEFINDTHQIAEIYRDVIDVNQKFYALARKLPNKHQLNKSMHNKRMPYFKNLSENTKFRHARAELIKKNVYSYNIPTGKKADKLITNEIAIERSLGGRKPEAGWIVILTKDNGIWEGNRFVRKPGKTTISYKYNGTEWIQDDDIQITKDGNGIMAVSTKVKEMGVDK